MSTYRAYDITTEWQGEPRDTAEQAELDAEQHNHGCARQGGYGSAVVVQRDHESPGRCVDLDGDPIWPPHGRSSGSVRWI